MRPAYLMLAWLVLGYAALLGTVLLALPSTCAPGLIIGHALLATLCAVFYVLRRSH